MIIGLLAEKAPETRVALTPENISALKALKVSDIMVEQSAGNPAFYTDSEYESQGANLFGRDEILQKADLFIGVNAPDDLPAGKAFLGTINPLGNHDYVEKVLKNNNTVFSVDVIPRTTRAQAMDTLSSMATVAGYRAALLGALKLPRFFPMFMTAAGSIKPSKVLILGAGVAGLQAIATAKRLGAVVEAFDVRQAAKEEVLSLGAKFVDVEGTTEDKSAGGYAIEQTEEFKKKQQQTIHDHAIKSDVIICTAQIPGRTAPVLLKAESVRGMKPGSVIIDLAASTGGNCELTQNDQTIVEHGVSIIGNSNLPGTMPGDASKMFGKNLINFLKILIIDGQMNVNFEDDLIAGTCVAHQGEIHSERVRQNFNSKN